MKNKYLIFVGIFVGGMIVGCIVSRKRTAMQNKKTLASAEKDIQKDEDFKNATGCC